MTIFIVASTVQFLNENVENIVEKGESAFTSGASKVIIVWLRIEYCIITAQTITLFVDGTLDSQAPVVSMLNWVGTDIIGKIHV